MLRLAMLLYPIIGTSCSGVGVIAALTMGQDTFAPIIIAAALGAVAAVPLSWFIARKLGALR